MDYPRLPAKKRGRMTVSGFDGGLGDDTGDIGDNQLTRALNLWWHEGRLRTRPGIRIRTDSAYPMEGRTVVMTSGGRTDIPFPGGRSADSQEAAPTPPVRIPPMKRL